MGDEERRQAAADMEAARIANAQAIQQAQQSAAALSAASTEAAALAANISAHLGR